MTHDYSKSYQERKRSLLALLLVSFLSILGSGCESSGEFAATPTGFTGGTVLPPGTDTGDGTLTFLFARAQVLVVPTATTRIRFEYLDSSQAVLRTNTFPFAPSITVTPPSGTVEVRLTPLSEDGFPLAEVRGAVPMPGAGQNIQVDTSGFLFSLVTLDRFSVTPDVIHLAGGASPGGTQQLTVTAIFSNGEVITFSAGALRKVNFSSAVPTVATVSGSGLVSAFDAGTTVLTASYTDPHGNGHQGKVEVNVDCSLAEQAATGRWVTVVNNSDTPPNDPTKNFFSYNQPSINAHGRVVFRARAKAPTGMGGGGEPLSGVWYRDLCGVSSPGIKTLADRVTLVPQPNNNNVTFTEFPSTPRIDINSNLTATRGNHQPVETIPLGGDETTKAGTTGLYFFDGLLSTGMSNLGNFPQYSIFQVPGVEAGTKFSVFPGSPSPSDGKYLVSKGNFVLASAPDDEETCVFFRDISNASNPATMVASSLGLIPGESVTFGSTAPPSAANGKVVFTGLDNEDAPTLGGIYLAPLTSNPTLTPLVEIGDLVPNSQGVALGDGSSFNAFGEGLAFDGRYLAFWAAWGSEKREIILECPADGNADIKQYCMENSPNGDGLWPMEVPVNQGIFLMDTQTNSLKLVARTGNGQEFQDFLYWVFSGRPPGVGGGDEGDDAEPPRWRASAFMTVDGARGVLFKGSRTPGEGVPKSGIYKSGLSNGNVGNTQKVVEVGDSHGSIDAGAPLDSTVTAVGLEREALRNGWLTLTFVFEGPPVEGEEEAEGWSGIYATYCPNFSAIPTGSPPLNM